MTVHRLVVKGKLSKQDQKIVKDILQPRRRKTCTIKVFPPAGNSKICYRSTAKAGRAYNDMSMEVILKLAADKVERAWPGETFRLVELKFGEYNLVHVPQVDNDATA